MIELKTVEGYPKEFSAFIKILQVNEYYAFFKPDLKVFCDLSFAPKLHYFLIKTHSVDISII